MKKTIWLALLTVIFAFGVPAAVTHAQVVGTVANQQIVQVPSVDGNGNQTTAYGLLSLPSSYNSSSQTYPLLIFSHGVGEAGSTISDLSKLYTSQNAGGPSYYIAQGTFPTSFVNPADGKSYQFIVFSPQEPSWAPYSTETLDEVVQYMVQHYRVDPNRIYLTGLSLGGGQDVYYVEEQSSRTDASNNPITIVPKYPAAAIVPMSAAARSPSASDVAVTIANQVHAWGFGSPSNDYWGVVTQNFITALGPTLGRFTQYYSGHTGWGNFYNPNYTETINGTPMNIYQWMLQYSRANLSGPSTFGGGTNPPAVNTTPPTVSAGSNQSITLPTSSVTLSGTATAASGAAIATTAWTQVSGPNTASIAALSSLSTSVSNLTSGTYVFKLTAIDTGGLSSSATVSITVNPGTIPGFVGTAGSEQVIQVPTDPAGSTDDALISLPANYSQNGTTKYPLIVFLHGMGEAGSGISGLANLYTSQNAGGPSYYIAQGTFPTSFVNPADGKSYQFIVLSPQASWFSPSPQSINDILPYMVSHYNVDPNRIYLTGLSAGGENLVSYTTGFVGSYVNGGYPQSYLPAAIVPMSASFSEYMPLSAFDTATVNEQVHAWGFGGTQDVYGVRTGQYVNGLGSYGRFTSYNAGHTGWGNYYNPAYTETINGTPMNIYQWMLMFTRANLATSTPTPVVSSNTPPSVSAGSAQSITLPTSSLSLSGSASAQSGASITSTTWTEQSGPVTAAIASPSSLSTSVSGLSASGTYVFQLSATDSNNLSSTATVSVTVAAAPQQTSPIEQYSFDSSTINLSTNTVSGVNGTPNGQLANFTSGSIQSGTQGQALSFNGSNSYVTLPSGILPSNNVFSISLWFKTNAQGVLVSENTAPVGVGPSGSWDPLLYVENGGKLRGGSFVYRLPNLESANAVNNNQWHNAVIVMNSANNTQSLYLDGALVGSDSSGEGPFSNVYLGTGMTQGWSNGNGSWFYYNGLMDNVQVYNRALSASEVATAYSNIAAQIPAANTPPSVSAGSAQSITLPTSSLSLSGSASAQSGASITSTTWTEQSGPVTAAIASPSSLSTSVSGLSASGTYVFQLSATDSNNLSSTATVSVTVAAAPNTTSQGNYSGQNYSVSNANGGTISLMLTPPQTLAMPVDKAYIYATVTPSWAGVSLTQVSGPTQTTQYSIGNISATVFQNLAPGTYVFQGHASSNGNSFNTYATTTITIAPDTTSPGDVSFTANSFVPTPTEPYGYGTNTGYFPGTPWLGNGLYDLIANVGGHATRTSLPDKFITDYGTATNLGNFQYFTNNLGFKGNVVFISAPSTDDQSTTTYNGVRSKLWKGMYDPIWSDGSNGDPINPDNTLAEYVYKLIRTYGPYVKYWEIVNEPDFTYDWSAAGADPTQSGNWWTNMPSLTDTPNMDAPVTAYIRVLRVAYEVIKKYDPNSLVCPGGLGYPSYLDAILRYTDNPNNGTVTAAYPLTGGAYMDCLSWHIYPEYRDSYWVGYSAPGNQDGFHYSRFSDYIGVNAFQDAYDSFTQVLQNHGYGTTYPAKVQIVTENGIASRQVSKGETGGVVLQRNFTIKASVQAQRMGLSQMFWYGLAGNEDNGTDGSSFDLMNLEYIADANGNTLPTPLLAESGVANLTMSKLLYGWKYDAAQSARLNLPNNLDGAAFSNGGQYRYVLWAKTNTDGSEIASGSYSFPASLGISSLKRVEWNYAQSGAVTTIGPASIALTGDPSFFIPASQSLPSVGQISVFPSTDYGNSSSNQPPQPSNTGNTTSGNPSSGGNTGNSNTSGTASSGSSGAANSGSTAGGGGGGGGSVSANTGSSGGSSPSAGSSVPSGTETSNSEGNAPATVSVTTPVLNVRSTPDGKILGRVTPKDTGTVIWQSDATPWVEVQFANGLSGFVYRNYISANSSAAAGNGTTGNGNTSTSGNPPSSTSSNGVTTPANAGGSSGSSATPSISITTPVLRVRSAPDGSILGVVKEGEQGTVIGSSPDGSWLKVQFPTFSGFVYREYTSPNVAPGSSSAPSTGGTGNENVPPAAAGSGSASASPSGSSPATVSVTTPILNVRSYPNGPILGRVTPKDTGTVIWQSDATPWVEVQFANGLSGFADGTYLSTHGSPAAAANTPAAHGTPPAPVPTPVTASPHVSFAAGTLVSVTAPALHVRSSPNGPVIGLVTKGQQGVVSSVSSGGAWVAITFPSGLEGYVYGSYLK